MTLLIIVVRVETITETELASARTKLLVYGEDAPCERPANERRVLVCVNQREVSPGQLLTNERAGAELVAHIRAGMPVSV